MPVPDAAAAVGEPMGIVGVNTCVSSCPPEAWLVRGEAWKPGGLLGVLTTSSREAVSGASGPTGEGRTEEGDADLVA